MWGVEGLEGLEGRGGGGGEGKEVVVVNNFFVLLELQVLRCVVGGDGCSGCVWGGGVGVVCVVCVGGVWEGCGRGWGCGVVGSAYTLAIFSRIFHILGRVPEPSASQSSIVERRRQPIWLLPVVLVIRIAKLIIDRCRFGFRRFHPSLVIQNGS